MRLKPRKMAMQRSMNERRQEKNYGYKPPLTHNQKSAEARLKG